jgi:AmmeMemoRadiSam system protein B
VRHVLILGPSHHVPFEGMAISSAKAFRTPLGDMPIDPDLRAIAKTMESMIEYEAAHSKEHSIEVQLPFLQSVLPESSILPVVVGLCDADLVSTFIQRCVLHVQEMLVVVSTDLSHYLSYVDSQAIDTGTAKQICELDATIESIQACGAYPLNGLLSACKALHWNMEQVCLKNSGDTAGDKNSVVGYGGFIARIGV